MFTFLLPRRCVLLGLGAVLLLADAVAAAPPPAVAPLDCIPADAKIVVQLHGWVRARERLSKLFQAAVPDFGPGLIAQLDEGIDDLLEGREFKGVPRDGHLIFFYTEIPPATDGKQGAVLVPCANYADFRDGILKEKERKALRKTPAGYEALDLDFIGSIYFLDAKNGYAAVTVSEKVADLLSKKFTPLSSKVSKPLAETLVGADVSLYVDAAAIQKQFASQLKGVRALAELAIKSGNLFGDKEKLDPTVKSATLRLVGGAFQALEDSDAVVLAGDLRPEGLAVRLQAGFRSGTPTDAALKKFTPGTLAELGDLPAGQPAYSAVQIDPAALPLLMPWLGLSASGPEAGPAAKATQTALDELAAAGPTGQLAVWGPGGGLSAWPCQDPAKAVAAQVKFFQALPAGASFQSVSLKGKPALKAEARKHRTFTLHEVRLSWDLDKMLAVLPADDRGRFRTLAQKVFGEGAQFWFGTDGKTFVNVSATDWEAARKQIDAYLDRKTALAADKGYQLTRQQLPTKANLLVLADTGRATLSLTELGLEVAKVFGEAPKGLPSLKPYKSKANYVGLAVVVQAGRAQIDLFVPVAAVEAVREVIKPLTDGAEAAP